MECLGCRYDLSGLTEPRCPECGRAFDRSDPSTFAPAAARRASAHRMVWLAGWIGCGPLGFVALMHLALVAARLELGRWPHRWGMDDPKELAGIGGTVYAIAQFGFLLIPLSLAGLGWPVAVLVWRRRWAHAVLAVLAFAGAWCVGFAFARWDPVDAGVWFFD